MTTHQDDHQGDFLSAPQLRARGWSQGMIRSLLGQVVDRNAGDKAGGERLWSIERIERLEATPEIQDRILSHLRQYRDDQLDRVRQCDCPAVGLVSSALLAQWGYAVALEASGGDEETALRALRAHDVRYIDDAGHILYSLAHPEG